VIATNPTPIDRIREAVLAGRFRLSDHAIEELDADGLHVVDVESVLLSGQIVREEPAMPDRPGPRYPVRGNATDLNAIVAVVCRFATTDLLLVITVYEVKK
jgi:hypothetical protein